MLVSVPSGPREGVPPRMEGVVPVQDIEAREESILVRDAAAAARWTLWVRPLGCPRFLRATAKLS